MTEQTITVQWEEDPKERYVAKSLVQKMELEGWTLVVIRPTGCVSDDIRYADITFRRNAE